jgi:hypothetical protein
MTTERIIAVEQYVQSHGVNVKPVRLDAATPARFDGTSIELNDALAAAEAAYYLLHSFGSIVGWSVDHAATRRMFDDLRDAKHRRRDNAAAFEAALERFRMFETTSSEFGAGVLASLGQHTEISDYSEFFRADLEAITIFHRAGALPVWEDFLAAWRADVAEGRRKRSPFQPRPIPRFTPQQIERQDVKRGVR